ncbi:MAG TPA: DNA polymerase III subunit delta [Candidatus Dormibacteraeota bacterium]|nr:DNA polymerase III subunit delta [Candidatus Dormibacteraeota bacterium]
MPAELDALLAAAAKRPQPVYLFIGEPFQTEPAARALIDALVPPDKRSFSLEQYDGRSTAIGPILDSLRTPSLFGGTKLIWVREPTLFLSGEKRADLGEALFAAVEEERPLEAAEKLLILAALAGWTQAEFAAADWAAMSGSDQSAVLGRRLEAGEGEILDSLRALCAERGLTVSAFRDDSGQLEHYLAGTPSPQTVLVFTASAADKRKRIVKTVQQCGTVVELTVQRERSGALSAESVDAMIGGALGATGKRLTPGARQLLVRRAGSQAGVLAGELEKLCLYVGDAATIDETAVRESVRDLAESWVFDFTKALAQRQAGAAVAQLRALFAQGEHPLRLLSLIARELRLLLLARDCLRGSLAGTWTQRTTYANFRDRLLPGLSEDEKTALGGIHPFVLYQCLQNASRTTGGHLQRGMLALQDLDIAFKSTPTDPRIRLEAFVLDFCRA